MFIPNSAAPHSPANLTLAAQVAVFDVLAAAAIEAIPPAWSLW
jgi:hypothetical protein